MIGQRAIRKINALLDNDTSWATHVGILEDWFSPADLAFARASRLENE